LGRLEIVGGWVGVEISHVDLLSFLNAAVVAGPAVLLIAYLELVFADLNGSRVPALHSSCEAVGDLALGPGATDRVSEGRDAHGDAPDQAPHSYGHEGERGSFLSGVVGHCQPLYGFRGVGVAESGDSLSGFAEVRRRSAWI